MILCQLIITGSAKQCEAQSVIGKKRPAIWFLDVMMTLWLGCLFTPDPNIRTLDSFVRTLNQTWDDGMRKAFKMKMCAEVKSGWTACWRKNCSKGGGAHCYLILKKIVTFQVMKTSCVFYAMERRTFSCTATSFWYLTLSKLNISTWNCKFVVMSISLLQET